MGETGGKGGGTESEAGGGMERESNEERMEEIGNSRKEVRVRQGRSKREKSPSNSLKMSVPSSVCLSKQSVS